MELNNVMIVLCFIVHLVLWDVFRFRLPNTISNQKSTLTQGAHSPWVSCIQNQGAVMNQARARDEQPIHKAFEVLPLWCEWGQVTPSIRYGASAQEVEDGKLEGIKIRRCPEEDLFAPMPDACLEEISRHRQEILVRAYGDDGFRNYSCAPRDDPDHLALVAKGLMTGPVYIKGALPKDHAYFYLSKQGAKAARSLLPRRRGKK